MLSAKSMAQRADVKISFFITLLNPFVSRISLIE